MRDNLIKFGLGALTLVGLLTVSLAQQILLVPGAERESFVQGYLLSAVGMVLLSVVPMHWAMHKNTFKVFPGKSLNLLIIVVCIIIMMEIPHKVQISALYLRNMENTAFRLVGVDFWTQAYLMVCFLLVALANLYAFVYKKSG